MLESKQSQDNGSHRNKKGQNIINDIANKKKYPESNLVLKINKAQSNETNSRILISNSLNSE